MAIFLMTHKQTLELFVREATALAQLRIVKSGLSSKLRVSGLDTGNIVTTESYPDEEDLRSFLLSFRRFISEREPIFLNRVYRIFIRHLKGADLDMVTSARAKFLAIPSKPVFLIKLNERVISPLEIVDLFLNGAYFHLDIEKRARVESLNPIERFIFKNEFLNYLDIVTDHIRFLRQVGEKHFISKE